MKFKRLHNSTKLEFYTADTNTPLKLPLFTSKVAANVYGFAKLRASDTFTFR